MPARAARLDARSPSAPRITKSALWAGLMSVRPRECASLTMCVWNARSRRCTSAISGSRPGFAPDIRKASLHYLTGNLTISGADMDAVTRLFPGHANARPARDGLEHELLVREAAAGASVAIDRL